jgi:hypothetical protein
MATQEEHPDTPNPEMDVLWMQEAEDRIDAYEHGEMTAIPAKVVFEEIRRSKNG